MTLSTTMHAYLLRFSTNPLHQRPRDDVQKASHNRWHGEAITWRRRNAATVFYAARPLHNVIGRLCTAVNTTVQETWQVRRSWLVKIQRLFSLFCLIFTHYMHFQWDGNTLHCCLLNAHFGTHSISSSIHTCSSSHTFRRLFTTYCL